MKFSAKLILYVLFLFGFSGNMVFAQKNQEILLTINKELYTKDDIVRLYRKNFDDTTAKINKKDFNEYLELFINYKLKVLDAKSLGFDTLKEFKKEYNNYRDDIKQPYLRNDSIFMAFVKQAYGRQKSAVRASHILAKAEYGSSAKDTLAAYKKIHDIEKRLAKGANFEALAVEVSDDYTARDSKDPETGESLIGNNGDLGYFSVFEIIYPIEEAAYSLDIGQISKPVHSDIGYHIVKPTNKLPLKGESFTIQHIWTGDDSLRALGLIQMAYSELNSGTDFSTVAKKYSQIGNVETDEGFLYSQKPSQIIPDYLEKIQNLQDSQYTAPFKTKYGWHILKLISVQPFMDYADQESSLQFRISRDERGFIAQKSFIDKLKKQQGFKENRKFLDEVRHYFNDSIFTNNWSYPVTAKLDKELFVFNSVSYSQKDFVNYIISTQTRGKRRVDLDFIYYGLYNEYVNNICLDWADSKIEEWHPDFKEMLNDYSEGLLIFAVNDRMVWSKAMIDTVGLRAFYEANKESHYTTDAKLLDSNYYMWNERVDLTQWTFKNNCISKEKALKVLETSQKKNWTSEKTFEELVKKADKKSEPDKNITFEWGIYEAIDQPEIAKTNWKKGVFVFEQNAGENEFEIDIIHEIRKPELKSLFDARGYYISDYQNYLEKRWIDNLRGKYSFSINQKVLNTVGN